MSEAIKLFQYNTLGALMAGLYGGTLTVGELLEHGDLDRKSTRLNSNHSQQSRMPSSA